MKVLVIGLGRSGRGAAKLLLQQGHEVAAVDRTPQEMEGVTVYPEDATVDADLVVLSSGVPRSHPQAVGRKVIGEAELALRTLKNRMVGITGTNGKTTTTLLITHVLNHAGIPAKALGNIGKSLAEYACHPAADEVLVVELSSYQLETLESVCFDVGLITNITPDHLDRYPSFEAYRETKLHLKDLVKKGIVNNAWEVCAFFGVDREDFNAALKTFKKPPHRMEFVCAIGGVSFINDSKGTNIASVMYSVKQVDTPLWLIAGGQSKKTSFEEWKELFPKKVKGIFAIGETASQIEKELGESVPVIGCRSLKEAVDKARGAASSGETVLLSPGCASFDQFKNFEERGEMFKEYIREVRKSG